MSNVDSDAEKQTKEPETRGIVRTRELVSKQIENIDPVTGFPFETPQVRQKLIEIFKEAIRGKRSLSFGSCDIDNLKGLNDRLGHSETNEVIKSVVQSKEEDLSHVEGVEAVYVYRPQAGGDEYRTIVIFSGDVPIENQKSLLSAVLDQPVLASDIEVNSSSGIVSYQFNGTEDAGQILQFTEEQSDFLTSSQKTDKLLQKVKETTGKGNTIPLKDYLKAIAEIWGGSRITEEGLTMILQHLVARTAAEMIASKRQP